MSTEISYKDIYEAIFNQKIDKLKKIPSDKQNDFSLEALVQFSLKESRAQQLIESLKPMVTAGKDGFVIWQEEDGLYGVAAQERGGQMNRKFTRSLAEALHFFFKMVLIGSLYLPPDLLD
jgi:hypothetical protein